jgi:putative transposase|tara:strand:+ start:66 stop:326 length:261 start_codon:yes stop_codon:yes gene_type:complete
MKETMTKKRDLKKILPDKVVDELLAGCEKPEDVMGHDGLLAQLTKRLVERALGGELSHHLGYESWQKPEESTKNCRNGYWEKTMVG